MRYFDIEFFAVVDGQRDTGRIGVISPTYEYHRDKVNDAIKGHLRLLKPDAHKVHIELQRINEVTEEEYLARSKNFIKMLSF